MHADDGALVEARFQNGSQCSSWRLGSRAARGSREADRVAALLGDPTHFLGHRPESKIIAFASGMKRRDGRQPLVDVPVVVRGGRTRRAVLVLRRRAEAAPEAGEAREQIEPRSPLMFMSRTRSSTSKQPGRISSKEVGSFPYSSGGRPATAFKPTLGTSAPGTTRCRPVLSLRMTRRDGLVLRREVASNMSGGSTTWSSTETRTRSFSSTEGPPVRVGQAGGPGRADGDVRCERPVGSPGGFLTGGSSTSSAGWSAAVHRGGHVAGSGHDVVIRGGNDRRRHRRRTYRPTSPSTAPDHHRRGRGRRPWPSGDRRRRRDRHPRLHRPPHPLRRPGHVGRARAVGHERHHDHRAGQLRRRLRAGATPPPTTPSST